MHSLVIATGSGFLLAAFAPLICRLARGVSGWVLSIFPAALFVYFAGLISRVGRSEVITTTMPLAGSFGIDLSLRLDGLGLIFALLITGIGALIFIYAQGYLGAHPQRGRFFAYLLLFFSAMLGLVLADNLLLLFVFWELTSISSYLLIAFEHEKDEARAAAWQALLVTALGGLALLAGAVLLQVITGSAEISELATRSQQIRSHAHYLPALLLFLLAALTKSAQFPFHFWLPNAMQAPTPVSAYLHSATMVKAGVYLLARMTPVLGGTDAWRSIVIIVGAVTMCVGAGLALMSTDMKQVLANLTISALGLMTMLLGVGTEAAITACLVFLLAHAFYKGALFMVAGAIDHATGTRDLQKLGGLRHIMPVTATAAFLAGISLAALGPVLSFIGKEMIFEALLHLRPGGPVFIAATVFAAAAYVGTAGVLILRPFFGAPRSLADHEASPSLWVSPLLLALLGVLFGFRPGALASSLLASATSATLGEPSAVKLALWHGWNLPLLLSLLSALLGAGLYLAWPRLVRLSSAPLLKWGPARCYAGLLTAVQRFAAFQSRTLQSGQLRRYLLVIICFGVALGATTFLSRTVVRWPIEVGVIYPHEWVIGFAILVGILGSVSLQSRIGVIASLSVVGYGVALLFVLFSAPDLAMTQFLVETLMLVLLVIAFYRLPRFERYSPRWVRVRDAVVAITGGGFVTALILAVLGTARGNELAQFYIQKSVPEARGNNVVNVILVDFRALDTLGEICVVVTAAVGVYTLLRLRLGKSRRPAARSAADICGGNP